VQQVQRTWLPSAECPQNQQHAWDRVGKSAAMKKANAFPWHLMGASRANGVEVDGWYVIAARHGTLRRKNTKFANSETIVLSNKNVLMKALVRIL
jgi:hypothetical protein